MHFKLTLLLIICTLTIALNSYGEGRQKLNETVCLEQGVRMAGNRTPYDEWISTNPRVASCDSNGYAYGLSPGIVTIYHCFKINGISDTDFHVLTVTETGDCPHPVTVEVYPNPNNGLFTVKLTSPVDEWAKTLLLDAAGKRVRAYEIMTNKKTYMPLQAQTGIYFLIVETYNTKVVTKVLVE